ncbi:molybdopterin-dependent oxidoreductase, partial [Thermodesulfobacteriota bacterium]
HRVNGVVLNLEGNVEGEGFEKLSRNKASVCVKSFGNIQKLYNPHRIKTPLKRTNQEKGRGIDPKWVEITWEEALNTIAEKLKKVINDDSRKFFEIGPGRKASINGTWEPFLKALGPVGNLRSGGGIHCRLSDHIFGLAIHGAYTCEIDDSYCNYFLILGSNRFATGGAPLAHQWLEARARGTRMVVVDPVLTVTAAKADEWIPIKPCTDTAFLLALIDVIIHEIGVYDEEFLKTMTNSPYLVGPHGYFLRGEKGNKPLVWDAGEQKAKPYDDGKIREFALEGTYKVDGVEAKPAFQVLKDHVYQYSPEWASEITDIPPHTIRRIAQELVDYAQIGSTIQIEGLTLPCRPVSTHIGRGVSGSMRLFHAFLAEHILDVLLGCLETVGGHKGGSNQRGGHFATKYGGYHSAIQSDTDGMVKINTYPFTWPPVSFDVKETLFPYGALTEVPTSQLSYINYFDPPKGFPLPPAPEMAIAFRVNPLLSLGDAKLVGESLKKVPFLVVIAYVENEVTELADIVLPDHTDLERYELASQKRVGGNKFSGTALRQPVVEPLYNTMDISDILTELADRAGFLDEYNEAINEGLGMGLAEPYQLKPNKKYAWVEIVDRQCKSNSDGKYDLEWFKKHGALLTPTGADKQYDVHLAMSAQKLRYPLPYMEHVKKTGEELKNNLAQVGIDWWSTDEYLPLPTYFPPILDELLEEYDFYVTRCQTMQFYRASNVEIPWLIESAEHVTGQGAIIMNADAAKERGIKDGDEIWVESPVARIKQKVKLIQGIRPDTLQIPGQFGHWKTPIAKDKQWVGLSALIPISYSWTDPLTGAMQSQVMKAKIYKDL